MELHLSPGQYIIAVSGGVDSVVLTDLLHAQYGRRAGYRFVIAHYDHGIREDSYLDQIFVAGIAKKYHYDYEYAEGALGNKASEALARQKRYEFLRAVARQYQAEAIITAHHQDDLIETVLLNLLRGTGRKGITSLSSSKSVKRPLLDYPKEALLQYAQANALSWREDPTNSDMRYRRNYVRHQLVQKMTDDMRSNLLSVVEKQRQLNAEIDEHIDAFLMRHSRQGVLDREALTALHPSVAREIIASWLRTQGIKDFDRKTIERLLDAAHTYRPNKYAMVLHGQAMRVGNHDLALNILER